MGRRYAPTDAFDVGLGDRNEVDTQRHESKFRRVQPGRFTVTHRGTTRTEHPIGSSADDIERPSHHANTVARELVGIVDEGEVVHGDHERHRRRTGHETRGVGHVDFTHDRFDLRPVEPVPRLVQCRSGEWQHGNAADGAELGNRNVGMPAGDEVEIDVVGSPVQLAGDPQRSDCGTAGRRVPTLLDRVGDTQR